MKKKIIGICVCTLLIVTMLPITGMAGDPENPEIEDGRNDITGPFSSFIPSVFFEDIDIISAWFFENDDQPEYLSVSLKVSKLKGCLFPTLYIVNWTYGGIEYSAVHGILWLGVLSSAMLTNGATGLYFPIYSSFDTNQNIITFIVPKDMIGNPRQGDVLTNTEALGVQALPIVTIIEWEDRAPNDGFGSDYTLQY